MMPSAFTTSDKARAMQAVSASVECGAFTSLLHKKGGDYCVYPRVKKTEKEAFINCVSGKGVQVAGDWINPPERKG